MNLKFREILLIDWSIPDCPRTRRQHFAVHCNCPPLAIPTMDMVWLVSSIDLSSDWLHPNWMVHRCDSGALQRMHRPDRFGLWSQSHVSECSVRSMSKYFSWKSMANPNWCRPIEMLVRAKWIYRRTMRYPWPDKSAKLTQFWMWTAFCLRTPNTDAPTTFPYRIEINFAVSSLSRTQSVQNTWFMVWTQRSAALSLSLSLTQHARCFVTTLAFLLHF